MCSGTRPKVIICTSTMFKYALEWTLMNTVEKYNDRWVAWGFLEILDIHFNSYATHVALMHVHQWYLAHLSRWLWSTSCISNNQTWNQLFPVLAAKLRCLNFHDGHSIILGIHLRNALFSLPTKTWNCILVRMQHRRMMTFDPNLVRSKADPCFYDGIEDGR